MPSPKTASKPEEEVLVKIIAVRKFAVEFSADELKEMESNDNHGRSYAGVTKMIEIGESAEVTKEVAKKLTGCGAAKPDYG